MDTLNKHREIFFQCVHPTAAPAHTAAVVVADLSGVFHAQPSHRLQLRIGYDLTIITLQDIELHLVERGFHLDNSLMVKLKRALFYYSEETLRANLGAVASRRHHTDNVFVKQYERREHGCRDQRPEHWRNYL